MGSYRHTTIAAELCTTPQFKFAATTRTSVPYTSMTCVQMSGKGKKGDGGPYKERHARYMSAGKKVRVAAGRPLSNSARALRAYGQKPNSGGRGKTAKKASVAMNNRRRALRHKKGRVPGHNERH